MRNDATDWADGMLKVARTTMFKGGGRQGSSGEPRVSQSEFALMMGVSRHVAELGAERRSPDHPALAPLALPPGIRRLLLKGYGKKRGAAEQSRFAMDRAGKGPQQRSTVPQAIGILK
jgi:hypothetical protein